MLKSIALTLALSAAVPVLSAAQTDDAFARKLAVGMVNELIQRQPQAAKHLQGIVIGLQNKLISVDEAKSLLEMARLSGVITGAQPTVVQAPAPAATPTGPQSEGELLGLLDEPAPSAPLAPAAKSTAAEDNNGPADLDAALAELNLKPVLKPDPELDKPLSAVVSEAPAPAPEEAPADDIPAELPPSRTITPLGTGAPPVANTAPAVRATVKKVKGGGTDGPVIIYLDRGSADGLKKDDRLRIQRDDLQVALAFVFNTQERISAAVVLESTWANGFSAVEVGDAVVRGD